MNGCFFQHGNFEWFQYFNFEINVLKKWKVLRLTTKHFLTKLLCQKPMLRQIGWGVQNWPITKNGVLPVTNFLFRKFCFSVGTAYIELIWCTNHPNVHIHTFRKRWSFTLGCFFPVGILKIDLNAAKIRTVQDYVCTKD